MNFSEENSEAKLSAANTSRRMVIGAPVVTRSQRHKLNPRELEALRNKGKEKNVTRGSKSGIVGMKQLENIQSLLGKFPNDGKDDSKTGQVMFEGCSRSCSVSHENQKMNDKLNDDIIDSVMHKVAELNKDKLPESSLVNVLASVYLDAKAKLKKRESELNMGVDVPTCIPSATLKETSMTVTDKKKLQWEHERAELALLATCNPWNKTVSQAATKLPQASLPFSTTVSSAPTIIDSRSSSHIPRTESSKISNLSGSTKLPALTSMAFAASQDIETMKREEQRRQWKADLDEQVRQQRLAHEQKLVEERRTQETSFEQHRQRVSEMHGVTDLPAQTTLTESSANTHPPRSSLDAHPSASHFTSSLVISDRLQSAVPGIPAELECTASVEPTAKVQFNRMRGFTQQMYSSPTDDAVRARRAEEIQRANLEMIEEKRRQREEEKVNKIMEEKLEEERLERERARLKALAEAELKEREEKEREEKLKTQLLFDTLKQAREEAASQKRHTRLARLQQTESETRSAYTTAKQSSQQQQYHPPPPPPQQQQQRNLKFEPSGSHYFSQPNNESLAAIRCVDAQTDTTAFVQPPVPGVNSTRLPQEDAECQTDVTEELARTLVLSGQKSPGKCTQKLSKLVRNSRASTVQQKLSVNPASTKCQSTGPPRPSKPSSQASFNKQAKSVPRTAQGTIRNRPANTSQPNTGPRRETVSSSLVDVAQDDYERKVYASGGPQRKMSNLTHNTSDSGKMGKPVRNSLLKQNSDSLVINEPTSEIKQTQVNGTVGISSREIPTHIPVPVSNRPNKSESDIAMHRSVESSSNRQSRSRYTDDFPSTYGAIDVVRTHNVLHPSGADEPIPLSREATARQNARQAYLKISNPSVYGHPPARSLAIEHRDNELDSKPIDSGNTDPLLNGTLVRDHPAQRQNTILQHLSEIRKGLQMRQMLYESGAYDDEVSD
ncbi:hypothetical protein P879_05079 [Paragonimus westermani]|uniref:CCDC66 domain-containing protein n=1 Tax=Paragonimus westermani TaxID=34504 RepID=A0A8T0DEX0_9TREM|nr:hypothetical protein P879_05079 [Paragonimus westermani]